jgi:hypothetical protein
VVIDEVRIGAVSAKALPSFSIFIFFAEASVLVSSIAIDVRAGMELEILMLVDLNFGF